MTPDPTHIRSAVPGRTGDGRAVPAASRQPTAADAGREPDEPVVIDCDACSMRGLGCGDCMVTVLLGGPPHDVCLDATERRAIDVLAKAGLIPPLRMVQAVDSIQLLSE